MQCCSMPVLCHACLTTFAHQLSCIAALCTEAWKCLFGQSARSSQCMDFSKGIFHRRSFWQQTIIPFWARESLLQQLQQGSISSCSKGVFHFAVSCKAHLTAEPTWLAFGVEEHSVHVRRIRCVLCCAENVKACTLHLLQHPHDTNPLCHAHGQTQVLHTNTHRSYKQAHRSYKQAHKFYKYTQIVQTGVHALLRADSFAAWEQRTAQLCV